MLMQNLVTGASVSRLPPKVPRFAMVRFLAVLADGDTGVLRSGRTGLRVRATD